MTARQPAGLEPAFDRFQLERAATAIDLPGCLLAERPLLLGAMRRCGIDASAFWGPDRIRTECRKQIDKENVTS